MHTAFVIFCLGSLAHDNHFHLPANIGISFCFQKLSQIKLCKCITVILIHSSIDAHLDCFQFLAILKEPEMNMVKEVSLWYDDACFGYIPKNGIA